MKYIRILATFSLMIYAAYLSDRLYVMQLKPIFNELTGIASIGYGLLTWLPRLVLGCAMGKNVARISNWLWNTEDEW